MKITVVTAAYNSGATLCDTLESVLSQDFTDFEHIIVDGNSTDNTLEIIKEYQPRYRGRLKWISEPDSGLYEAMNKGISLATGDVVGLLNSDDFFADSHVLSRIAESIAGYDSVCGDILYVDRRDTGCHKRLYSSAGFRNWKFRLGIAPAHPTFYCTRSVYDRCGLYDISMKSTADFEFMVRAFSRYGITCRYIGGTLVCMRDGGVTSSGWKSYKRSLVERKYAFRRNGIPVNYFMLGLGYMIKLSDLVRFRIVRRVKAATGRNNK